MLLKNSMDSLQKIINRKQWDRNFVYATEVAVQNKRMIRDKNYKYIMAMSDGKCKYCEKYHCQGDEFYDLKNDPEENKNIIQNPKHKTYKKELDNYFNSLTKPIVRQKVAFGDEKEVERKLQDLGYL